MCAEVDYYPHLLMNKTLLTTQYERRSSWTPSISSSSTSSNAATSWLERKLFRHFKRIFRRKSLSLTSDSTVSSRRPSLSINELSSETKEEDEEQEEEEEKERIPEPITNETKIEISASTTQVDSLYDYNCLLARCLQQCEHDRIELIQRCQTPISIPHADLLVGHSRTVILNWKSYLRLFHLLQRDIHLFQQYINEYYSCQTSLNSREQLTLNIRTNQVTFDNILRKFLDDYVTCLNCQTAQTHLIKSDHIWRIECQLCGSQRTVQRLRWKHCLKS